MLSDLASLQMDKTATSPVLLINVFSQKMETCFQPQGQVNLLHKLGLITTLRGGRRPWRHLVRRGIKETRHFGLLLSHEEMPDLSEVQAARSLCLPVIENRSASCCLTGTERLSGGTQ